MPSESTALPAQPDAPWMPKVNPWLITMAVMSATFLEILDTSVANVALPHMAGSLSVTSNEATWVLTSYLVANAIVLPMTGWFGNFFGRKRFLMSCVGLFTFASALCGSAHSMGTLILWRVVQGAAGGALQPLSQSILMESFPVAKRGMAMAAFGMGVVVAPIIGPTLGGWITDNYSWRWIFYINLPIGAFALTACQAYLEDPPYIKAAKARARGGVDFIGFGFMAVWLATLQIILDKGQLEDWFNAPWICWFAAISAVCMVSFIFWELRVEHPLVNLRILENRNFAVGVCIITLMGVVLYSSVTLLPLFLQNVMGYSALDSGLAVSPRGIGAIISMMLVGRMIGKIDSRAIIMGGFTILAFSSHMFTNITLEIAQRDVVIPNIIMGLAMGFIFVPLTTTAMGNLPNEQMGNAAGIYNLMRNLGGGFGISGVTTMLARGAQTHQAILGAHLNPYNPIFQQQFAASTGFIAREVGVGNAAPMVYSTFYHQLVGQATLMAFVDNFSFLAYLALFCIPCILLFKKVQPLKGPIAAH